MDTFSTESGWQGESDSTGSGTKVTRLAARLLILPVRAFFEGLGAMVRSSSQGSTQAPWSPVEPVSDPTREGTRSSVSGPGPRPLPTLLDIIDDRVEEKPVKEERKMISDQDLSGSMVKAVQYTIISVVTGIQDNARVLLEHPKTVAFADDMTPEDFASWIIALNCEELDRCKDKDQKNGCYDARRFDRKYLRVAYLVMGRFNAADINYEEWQALALSKIAHELTQRPYPVAVDNTPEAPVPVLPVEPDEPPTKGKKQ